MRVILVSGFGIFLCSCCIGFASLHFASASAKRAGDGMKALLPQDRLAGVAFTLMEPERMSEASASEAGGFFNRISGPLKTQMTKLVVKEGLDKLRGEFAGLDEEGKKLKAKEIADYISSNDAIAKTAPKMLNKDFITRGIAVYMKETTPAERALFDPIVNSYIQKANSGGAAN